MNIKSILFNTEEVRATLDGRKTAKRLLVKPQFEFEFLKFAEWDDEGEYFDFHYENATEAWDYLVKPPYRPGDILYVRETWREIKAWSGSFGFGCEVEYKAGGTQVFPGHNWKNPQQVTPWNPSIHMPREAARIWLRVTDVRAERLQEMRLHDFYREGITHDDVDERDAFRPMRAAKWLFERVWNSTLKPADRDRYGWAANPWVWVIEFERCEKPEEG